mgnify:FL=1|tara:strand:+ start:60 stop:482 length:423 start_codon:yes stop_codon:yes gene_type:complete
MNKKFNIIKIDHIAFATDSLKKSSSFLTDFLGLKHSKIEKIVEEKVNVLKFFNDKNHTALELLEPISKSSTISKYLKLKGKSLHHIALEVDNIQNAIFYLKANNIQIIYEKPQIGADKKLITFIHPKETPGLLLELCQYS